ncbi:MAG: Asp-tRNA(Asn)/Glu-tRNA(Gln) amidotransferase subunit GatC [Candidatus Pacebacteria bacterium]|nr:Asp-tRNA(Asn)/Glu-tRNA(Gln) amidotransferase subunit GatC [Candidatus Paceibacterota bacterium]
MRTLDKKGISIEEVEHISQMARISLTQEEKQKFSNELSGVLEYIEQLSEVDTSKIEPVSQVTGITNALRDDIAVPCDKETKKWIIDNFPQEDDGYIKVKQVM